MKIHNQQPETVSHTIQHKTKAANQAHMHAVLQKYAHSMENGELRMESVQRQADDELDDELLQGKFSDTAQRTESQLPPSGGGGATGIPAPMKSGFENMSGFSFDDVRVHYNSSKPAQLQALAYTQGNQVHIAPGQEKHLGHELGHVVQQKQGRVQPTMQLQGVNVNDNEGLEREADRWGERAVQRKQDSYEFQSKSQNTNQIIINGYESDCIQGIFNIQQDPSVAAANLSIDAQTRIGHLQNDLANTYGQMYDIQWNIDIYIEKGISDTPAYTKFSGANTIAVYLARWFVERCSYGELLGMVNHELNVHNFADIAILSAEELNASGIIASNAHLLQQNIIGQGAMLINVINYAANTAALVGAGAARGALTFTPGISLQNNAFNIIAPQGGAPAVLAGMVPPARFVGAGAGVQQVAFIGSMMTYDFNNNAIPTPLSQNPAIGPAPAPTPQESSQTMTGRGGQRDHASMSQVSFDQATNTITFSPRALVYAQMTVKLINDFINNNGGVIPVNPAHTGIVADMLGYFFLDVARTWHEALTGTSIQRVQARNFLFMLNGDNVQQMALRYFDWMFDAVGNPNPALGIPTPAGFSPASATAVIAARPLVLAKIQSQRTQMLGLIGRAALSLGIEMLYRNPRDWFM